MQPSHDNEYVPLGNTGLSISPIGIGTWAWGDKLFWQYGKGGFSDADLRAAFDASVEAGINWFDTAELYGSGRSEKLLGEFVRAAGQQVLVATKFFPYPWRLSRGALRRALRGSLKRLGLEKTDLYQIHWPFPPRSIETWVNELANAAQAGLVRAAGVSNYNLDQTRRARELLEARGLPLASNQVPYSLIDRKIETNGLLAYCREFNITVIAYSPLGQGVLTGKYTPDNPPPGVRGRRYNPDYLRRVQPLIGLLKEIGQAHGGKTPAQVALNWAICKGTVPIPGAKNARQARDNAGALGWRLTGEQVAALDKASSNVLGLSSV